MTNRRAFIEAVLAAAIMPGIGTSQTAAELTVGGGTIQVSFEGGPCDLSSTELLAWISTAAKAVSSYFGRFPVDRARVVVTIVGGRTGVLHGTSWGYDGALTKIAVGQNTTHDQLNQDWMMTHEFVHYGFPSQRRSHHWIEEGSATYIEPIARAQIGALSSQEVWSEMVRDMPQGIPSADEHGLDYTHSWAATYWGGAIFCLVADVRIRERTATQKGFEDAIRAINHAGGNIQVDWPLERAFAVGDRATGTNVLAELYQQMGLQHPTVDLVALWQELGIERRDHTIAFNESAPLAGVRRAILS